MTWSEHKFAKVEKTNLNVEFAKKDVEMMREIKNAKNGEWTWAEFFFYAAVNVRIKKKKEVKK